MNKGRFPYKRLSKYPHMKPLDVEVWDRFISEHPDFFNTVDYDVHIGEGAEFLPTGTNTPDERENRLYQRKIDVVGYTDNETWIIEIKPQADMFALGQILTYKDLSEKDDRFGPATKYAVFCGQVKSEMKPVYATHGIVVIVT